MDFSKLSDAELEAMANPKPQNMPAPKAFDVSKMSDEELEKIAAPNAQPYEENNPVVSGVRKLVQGASGKFSDEIAGAVEAAGRVAGVNGLGVGDIRNVSRSDDGPTMDWGVLRDAYKRARDTELTDLKKDAKDNPKISNISEFIGATVSPANKVVKGASLAKAGLALGGLTGLGASEAESLPGLFIDTGTGALIGGGVGKALQVATPAAKAVSTAVSESAKKMAEKFAFRALGAERGSLGKMGQGKALEAGRYALDNKLLRFADSTDDMLAKNTKLQNAAMDARAAAYKKIDDVGASAFSPRETAKKVEGSVIGDKNMAFDDVKELASTLKPHLDNILSRGEKNISMLEAQKLVNALQKKAKWDTSRSSEANQVAKDVYRVVRKSINDSAETGADKIGVKGLKETIENANKTFSTGQNAKTFLVNKLKKEQGNNFFSLTNTLTGGAGVTYGSVTGDWDTAIMGMAAKKGLEKYGAKMSARALNSIAKSFATSKGAASLIERNPGVLAVITKQLMPEGLSLPQAADRGGSPDREKAVAKLKGQSKWTLDGFAKLSGSDSDDIFSDEENVEKLFSSKKGKQLLMEASDLKQGSKALEKVYSQVKIETEKGKK